MLYEVITRGVAGAVEGAHPARLVAGRAGEFVEQAAREFGGDQAEVLGALESYNFV